jgi:hypothetical protein
MCTNQYMYMYVCVYDIVCVREREGGRGEREELRICVIECVRTGE